MTEIQMCRIQAILIVQRMASVCLNREEPPGEKGIPEEK